MSRSLPLALLSVLAACLGADVATESSSWGVGDDPSCDPALEHCWPEADRAVLAAAINALDEVMGAAPADRVGLLRTAVATARGLGHKLTPDELAGLDEEEARLAEAAPELSDEAAAQEAAAIRSRSLHRLESGMIAAHMVPVSDEIIDLVEGSPCDGAEVACAGETGTPVTIPSRYSEGTRTALAQIAGSSLLGKAIAAMLTTNGALDMDYAVANARLFGEYDEATGTIRDSGLSPTARVQRIIDHAKSLAAWAGAVAGAESLVPLAGVAISIGHEEWMLFEIHSKMVFRIAQVYGWDLRDGPALINAVGLIMQEGLLLEGTDILLSNVAVPLIMRRIGAQFGYRTADQIVANLTGSLSRRLLALVSAKARKKLTREVVEGGAKAVAKQVFGWLTFGATVAISSGADWYFTGVLGQRVANSAKRWLGDFLHEGSTFLGRDEARECAFGLYARIVAADGRVTDLERNLFQTYLAHDYWMSETLHWPMARSEQVAHAARLREVFDRRSDAAFTSGVDACIDTAFADADEQHRMSILAFLYAVGQIDGDETASERDLYRAYRTRMRGPMFRRLDDSLMDQIERTVLAEIRLPQTDVGVEYGIALEDVVPALNVPAATQAAYAEGNGP